MMFRTHLTIGIGAFLLFLPHMNNKIVFSVVVLFASLLPDIDSSSSYLGQKKLLRPVQFFVKHRGVIHSLTMCVVLSIVLGIIYAPLAFPFFLGYSLHLLADSFSVEGIRPFWPLKREIEGKIGVGGRIEKGVFLILCGIDFVLLVTLFI